ncbi:adenylyl-sulfate kinase [Stackebrandtia nassauensis]|uniref:adenylyl-sulfate kinase n=1 Tax=Stackebrandtia nassauensis (strain DSM 44728 / CIP 108903 / NRRL B-16338 / NBRC 102104 / LLR-40K-21) TaxID=446470 RepID=D3PZ05_STANL|nr:adenylyl-sulfate kinase [Stackebrandtia nassauensis]ADD45434.1 adenylylsulfate kinase [Stackebrandtia nassauensis DSM 44728]
MVSDWVLPDEVLADAPSYTPRPHELADLELLLSGAYAPLNRFLGTEDVDSVAAAGTLADGTQWPTPVTLHVPADTVSSLDSSSPMSRVLVLTDPEGVPVAAVDAVELTPVGDGSVRVAGPVRRIGEVLHGPFRRLRATPAATRETLTTQRVLGVIADRPLHRPQLAEISRAAHTLAAHVLILIPVAGLGPDGLPPAVLVRSIMAARDRLPKSTIVAVPLSQRGDDVRDGLLSSRVAAAYGATHLLSMGRSFAAGGSGVRIMLPRQLCYDARDGQWRALEDVEPPFRRQAMSPSEISDMLDRGFGLPDWHTPPAVAAELRRARPPRRKRGVVVFMTGLSGSGKSTIARGVYDALLETGERTVSLFDGDVVRRLLSSELGFSGTDREANIRRIAYVASEVAHHHGVALCCPIAPYAAGRAEARRMAAEAGADFILVHVSTPLEVCEERDRKGLYAKARAGVIESFTGITDPYEVPKNADLTVDTSEIAVDEAIGQVIDYLVDGGWIETVPY